MVKKLDNTQYALNSLLSLKGKTALVTGGAGWLGTHMCEVLVELGARVFIASRNIAQHAQIKEHLEINFPDAPPIESIELDLVDEGSVHKCFSSILGKAGKIDILINNAYSGKATSFEQTTINEWNQIIDIGLTGYFLCTKEAAKCMRASNGGVIINVASMYGMVSPDFGIYEGTEFSSSPAYGAAKAGVIQLTKYAACELAKYNIRVNSVSFGPFPSNSVQQHPEFISKLAKKTPLGRTGFPWEVKGPLAFLATDASSYMTGQNLVIDGGWTAW